MIRSVVASFCLLFALSAIGCDQGANPGPAGDADADAGRQLIKQRKFAEAIPHFERALEQPLAVYNKSLVLTMIGNCYYQLDQFEKSLEYMYN